MRMVRLPVAFKEALLGGSVLFRLHARKRSVCLTFDDGPHPEHTPRILETLEREGIRATFFLVGSETAKYPALVRRMREKGHALGNHTYTHPRLACLDEAGIRREIRRTAEAIEKASGACPDLVRAPYGALSYRLIRYAAGNRLRLVQWSVDIGDSFVTSPDALIRRIETTALRGGDIVLLHEDVRHTVEGLGAIIAEIRRKGFSFGNIPTY